MNEILFFIQTFLIIAFGLATLRLGKGALITWVSIQALLANLFVLKQIDLFGFHVTASDAFVIGSLLGLNLLQEFFSRDEALKATYICFFFLLFFTVISQLHLLYTPSAHDFAQESFATLLTPSPRLFVASMGVFFLVQQLDVRIFSFLKGFSGLSFPVRAGLSLVVSQFIDTVLFSFAGLYGIVGSITDIIVVSFLIKTLVILCFTSSMRWVKA